MSDTVFGYTVQLAIKDGKLDEFKARLNATVKAVDASEPNTRMYSFYLSPDERTCTGIEFFRDDDAAIAHLTGVAPQSHLPGLLEVSDLTDIQVYGEPGEKLAEVLSNYPVKATHGRLDGFVR